MTNDMDVEEAGLDRIKEYEAVVESANRINGPLDDKAKLLIDRLIKDLDCLEDPIYHANCLQLVADLASSSYALSVLDDKQVPKKLISFLFQGDPLIVPHALKMFYKINPSDLQRKYPPVLDKVFDYCQSENNQLLDYAIDFIAAIVRQGYYARKVLISHPDFKTKCLKQFGSTIISSNGLLKSRTLNCIAEMLKVHEDDPKEAASKLSEELYFAIIEGEHGMTKQLLSLCRVPFMEIRISAMLIIETITLQEWGIKVISSDEEFIKWVVEKSTETCKEGKETKAAILKNLKKTPTCQAALETAASDPS